MKRSILLIVVVLVFVASMTWAETAEDVKLDKMHTVVEEWFKKGREAHKAKNYEEAIKCFKKASTINPNSASIHYNLGVTYYDKGMLDESITEYKKAIAIYPNYIDAVYNLGLAYSEKELMDRAIAEFKKVIAINPNSADAHHNLGYSYFVKGMNSMASDHFYKAGLLYHKQGKRRWALRAYEDLKLTNSKELEQDLYEKLYPEMKEEKGFFEKVLEIIR